MKPMRQAAPPPTPLPLDVRLMHAAASLLLAVAALLALAGVAGWLARGPAFTLRGITVTGDVAHYNAITLRANVLPHLQGGLFTIDLRQAQQRFQALPWVRQAIVRRDFPDRLKVQLEEHQALAYWGPEADNTLINSFGEVFEANVGELAREDLPRLSGPQDRAAQVLAMFQVLAPVFEPLDLRMDRLSLSPQGGWRAEFANGAEMELGRGDAGALLARAQRFLNTVPEVAARYQRLPEQLASVDLRHTDGYAIRLQGVSTLEADAGRPQQVRNR